MTPKLKFKIDPRQDLEAYIGFYNNAKYDSGRSWQWAIAKIFPELQQFNPTTGSSLPRRAIIKFIKKIYLEKGREIKRELSKTKRLWGKKERRFYELTNELFDKKFWPKGKYVAYPTIWGMFPRDLKNKTFQISGYRKSKVKVPVIIAHELLHFVFYSYFLKKHPEYRLEKYQMQLWHISEIFNEIVQGSMKWKKFFGGQPLGYPEHARIVKKLLKKVGNRVETDIFIESIVQEVERNLA